MRDYSIINISITLIILMGTIFSFVNIAGGKDMSAAKKALMIIAHQNFRDEEYSQPRTILENAGVEITVASSSLNTCKGTLGSNVMPDILLGNVDVANFDCIIFVGGAGASEYFNNPQALSIVKQAAASNKILAAICIAPAILANAEVLQQKRVTSFPSVKKDLQEHLSLIHI